jgi:replicative DNA helicase
MALEKLILANLVYNEEYGRKVIPFLKDEYFSDNNDRTVFGLIDSFVKKYNSFPTKEALAIDLSNKNGINEETFKNCKNIIKDLEVSDIKEAWLLDETEKFCQEKSIYNAIMQSIQILDDKTAQLSKGSIPQILSDALAVSFDSHIGHDFIDNYKERFDFYHLKENKIPFDLEYFNTITQGGLSNKSLNVVMSGTGGGKSLFLCHSAASNLLAGLNVLYITLEMSEERIAERIDSNLLDIPILELKSTPIEIYEKKISRLKIRSGGKLIIKEYPTSSAGSGNFRHLLNELKLKRNFIPQIIYIDYLNICSSSRIKSGSLVNSYTYVKTIAEELRGLAVEFNVPIFTATQSTRGGYNNSEIEITDISESFGLAATSDLLFAIVTSDELEQFNQVMIKQLKNRYNDINTCKKFVIGIDRSKMRLYDVEQSAQENILDGPVMDNTPFGQEDSERSKKKKKFSGFK